MEETNTFRTFDMVSDDSDHYFLGSNNGNYCFNDSSSRVYKAIVKEWKMLQENLPKSIYVRVYERRIDLMRAVIVGAAGTPYHDGLFFFDIKFPYDYPRHPPKLHYHSFGRRPNPNLWSNGKVCLSLLNTWHGKKTEMWDPSRSTMLQVLVSIQGLVLNDNPFYNEPFPFCIFDSETKSRACIDLFFVITCNISVLQLHAPPPNFESFVRAHFRHRAFPILAACNQYVNGRVRVGYFSSELPPSSSSSSVKVSRDFKERMVQFYPELLEAFRMNGASLEGSIENLVVESEQSENKSSGQREQKSKNKNSGIFKKVVGKIKKAFGRKKNGKKKNCHIEVKNGSLESAS